MNNKRTKWWYHAPGMAHPWDFHFSEPVSRKKALAYIRDYMQVKRLPRGYEVWF